MIAARRWHRLRLDDLARLHVALSRAMSFIETADYTPTRLGADSAALPQRLRATAQLDLWSTSLRSVNTGEL